MAISPKPTSGQATGNDPNFRIARDPGVKTSDESLPERCFSVFCSKQVHERGELRQFPDVCECEGSCKKNGQQANPVWTDRSSHSRAIRVCPNVE